MKPIYRQFLILFCLSLFLMASCFATGAELSSSSPGVWNGTPIVQTRYGTVQGMKDKDQTWVWKTIPFARPPVGDLRWRAPQDPLPWEGVRRQSSFNKGCTQYSMLGGIKGSEDCLYLNVWRPQSSETLLPVYVWIHGGGNSLGSATMVRDYYGNRLASHSNMVFVSLNYRLGPMGWFTHPALREGTSPEDDSGNYGTLDIIQALKWIQENITAFGGDPERVMITGESAGGFNVLSMLISPRSTGLFSRAMCQSGFPTTRSMADGEAKSGQVLAQLLAADGKAKTLEAAEALAAAMTSEEIRTYLRGKSSQEILRCYKGGVGGMVDNPAIFRDGYVIPSDGYEALAKGTYPNKVPLIIGTNREECKLFLYFQKDIPWKSELYLGLAKYGSQYWKAAGVDEVVRKLSANPDQPPVYAYEFAWGAPNEVGISPLPGNWGRRLGSFHSLEVPFFLGTDTVDGFLQMFIYNNKNKPGRQALSRAMMEYAARFARTGNPNPAEELSEQVWAPWSNQPHGPKCIVFNVNGATPVMEMSNKEYTREGVLAALQSEVQEPDQRRILDYINGVFDMMQ